MTTTDDQRAVLRGYAGKEFRSSAWSYRCGIDRRT